MNLQPTTGAPDRPPTDYRRTLEELYRAAVRAAEPEAAVRRALATIPAPAAPVWIFALGKAAVPMAAGAVAILRDRGTHPAGGLVVSPAPALPPHPALETATGDHPEPGAASLEAAAALARVTARVGAGDEAWVLLSGGATSLLGAPVNGVAPSDLRALYALLLGSGLDITAMNRIRKRFSRWGGGRLAQALAPARVRTFVVSDVIGDDLSSIGSGPCEPDPTTAAEIRAALEEARLWDRLPPSLGATLCAMEAGQVPETPKPGDPIFEGVETRLIASNRLALDAAAAEARARGFDVRIVPEPLRGEAAEVGRAIAREMVRYAASAGPQPSPGRVRHCRIWGGETTVSLGDGPPGLGGRSQELALAAAQVLAEAGPGPLPAILAAGTDGRDGPTDAAGAIVTGDTWQAIRRAGRDPAADLAGHNAYPALAGAGALLRTGLTGTNVMDLVVALA